MEKTQYRTPLLLGVAISVVMTVAIVYGMISGGFVDGLRTVFGDPWGRVSMVDLASGFILFGAWIRLREGSFRRAAPWWVALLITGNLAAGIYLATAAYRASSTSETLLGQHGSR